MSLEQWQVSDTLLHGEFGVYPSKGIRYALSLTRTGLHIQRLVPKPEDDQRTVLPLLDMVGCHTLRNRSSTDSFAYFSIYSYPLKKKKVTMGSSRTRQRLVRTFRVDEASEYEKNQAVAEKWATAIKCLVHGLPIGSEPERHNHARELVQGINLAEWDGIVVISGDGLLYEVINGLMERPDWEDAIKMPVGIIPCGSGNALAGSINYNAGFEQAMGSELLLNCILLLCRGTVVPMDLVSVTSCSGIRSFSFLSVAWGFISDVDIESEKYRHMGSARFTVGTMVRVASLRTYRGRLSYLPVLDAHRPISRSITLAPNGSLVPFHRAQLHRTISDIGLCEERNVMYKRSSASLDTNELPSFETSPSPSSPTALHSSSFTFDSVTDDPLQHNHVLPNDMEPQTHHQVNGPKDDLLAPMEHPVPKTWVTVEEDFVLVLAIYQSHLGADLLTAPFSFFDDGLIHLFFVKAGISRAALVRLFLAMEKGTHFETQCPYLIHVPVRAFRLEPLTRKGIITVDGERVEYGPIQAQIHNGLSNLITGSHRVRMTNF
ncbi:hypothetical protein FKM82_013450 [Ascaphus truei]|uniref:sphingosine kinase 2 isoform X2 n=1 Tax=Ascaphus truei TaxID=8439 RepID=UPI003F5A103F